MQTIKELNITDDGCSEASVKRRIKLIEKLEIPVIQGGMGVGISLGNLAGHVALEGGMGTISTAVIGFREEDFRKNSKEANMRALEKEIIKAKEISGGRGLVAINAMTVTNNFKESVEKACGCGIDAVISGAGLPLNLPELVTNEDVLIAPIVSSGKAASLIMKSWKRNYHRRPDFIVVEGPLAGGHLGFKREELENGAEKNLEEIVREVADVAEDIPVFAAGGIFDEADVRAAISWGAAGVQVGTRFICTDECDATQGFKDVILNAKAEDVEITKSPVGLPGRAITSEILNILTSGERKPPKTCIDCIRTCDPKTTPYCISDALIKAYGGDLENGLFFSGSNCYRINEMTTVKNIMEELARGFR